MDKERSELIPISDAFSREDSILLSQSVELAVHRYIRSNSLNWRDEQIVRDADAIITQVFSLDSSPPPKKWTQKEFTRRINYGLEKRSQFIHDAENILTYLSQEVPDSRMTRAQMFGILPERLLAAQKEIDQSVIQVNFQQSASLVQEFERRERVHKELTIRSLTSLTGEEGSSIYQNLIQTKERFLFESGVMKGVVVGGLLVSFPDQSMRSKQLNPFAFEPQDIRNLHLLSSYFKNDMKLVETAFLLTRNFNVRPEDHEIAYEIFLSYIDGLTKRFVAFKFPPTDEVKYWDKLYEAFNDIPNDPSGLATTFVFDPPARPAEVSDQMLHLWKHAVPMSYYLIPSVSDLLLAKRVLSKSKHNDEMQTRRIQVQRGLDAWLHYQNSKTVYPRKISELRTSISRATEQIEILKNQEASKVASREAQSIKKSLRAFDAASTLYEEAMMIHKLTTTGISDAEKAPFLAIMQRITEEQYRNALSNRQRLVSHLLRPTILSLYKTLPTSFAVSPTEFSDNAVLLYQHISEITPDLDQEILPEFYRQNLDNPQMEHLVTQIQFSRNRRELVVARFIQEYENTRSPEEKKRALVNLLSRDVHRTKKILNDFITENEIIQMIERLKGEMQALPNDINILAPEDIRRISQSLITEEKKIYYQNLLMDMPTEMNKITPLQYDEARQVLRSFSLYSRPKHTTPQSLKNTWDYGRAMDVMVNHIDNPFFPASLYTGKSTAQIRESLHLWIRLYEKSRDEKKFRERLEIVEKDINPHSTIIGNISSLTIRQRQDQEKLQKLERELEKPKRRLVQRFKHLGWAIKK